MNRALAMLSALLVAAATAPADALAADSEIGALHLAFERPVKMRRLRARLYLSTVDSVAGIETGEPLSCAALPSGSAGRLPARGELRLRLLAGEADPPWESDVIARALDARGEAGFTAGEIATLAGDAPSGSAVDLLEIELRGGKGKKVKTLVLDCAWQAVE